MKVPCKLCITYAVCKCKETIRCDKLFNYVKTTNRYPQRILPNTLDIGQMEGSTFFTNRKAKYNEYWNQKAKNEDTL